MTRHGLLAILALTGLVLPEPTFARPSFRPAFTGGPFQIVVPMGRPHGRHLGAPRLGRPAMRPHIGPPKMVTPPAAKPSGPVTHTVSLGPKPFRIHRRGFHGSPFPVTVGGFFSYYGAPYDPSDIPVYGPRTVAVEEAPAVAAPPGAAAIGNSGCRAQQVTVPNAAGNGDSAITIVRC